MTLILTMVSKLGIVMAADSSVTLRNSQRSFSGAQKLLPIRPLNAGIAAWGAGAIGNKDTDEWLQAFVNTEIDSTMTLWEAAEVLAKHLNRALRRPLKSFSGIHMAGYDIDSDGEKYPAVYHIHNVNGVYEVGIMEDGQIGVLPGPTTGEFQAHKDHPPTPMEDNKWFMLRNGNIFLSNVLWEYISKIFDSLSDQTLLTIPYPRTLDNYGEYLRIWITFIGQLYRHSSAYPHKLDMPMNIGAASIGGPVSVLTIDKDGIQSFYAA